jgi:hypothetical protein
MQTFHFRFRYRERKLIDYATVELDAPNAEGEQ